MHSKARYTRILFPRPVATGRLPPKVLSKARPFPVRQILRRYGTPSSAPPQGRILGSIESGPEHAQRVHTPGSVGSQALQVASNFGEASKLAIFGCLSISLLATTGYLGLQLWLERREMPPPRLEGAEADRFGWDEDAASSFGWSGGHLGTGTDPRIGFMNRLKVHEAWFSSHWQTGKASVPLSEGGMTTTVDSVTGKRGTRLVDAGHARALEVLDQVLTTLRETPMRPNDQAAPDRALVELEQRLAGIRESVGTPEQLMEASKGLEVVWAACVAQAEREGGERKQSWALREAMRVALRLGDVCAKAAGVLPPASGDAAKQRQKSEEFLVWAINAGLFLAVSEGRESRQVVVADGSPVLPPYPASHTPSPASPQRGFFFWARSEPKAPGGVQPIAPGLLKPEISHILASLNALAPPTATESESKQSLTHASSVPSAMTRATISALLNLSTSMVPVSLATAYDLQSATLNYLRSIPRPSDAGPGAELHASWLETRQALAGLYAAEVGRASGRLSSLEAVQLCSEVLANCLGTVHRFSASPKSPLAVCGVVRDARLTGAMAANLAGTIYEMECPSSAALTKKKGKGERAPEWCGERAGDTTAAEFFKAAVQLGNSASRDEGGNIGSDSTGGEGEIWKESMENLQRVQKTAGAA